MKNIGSDIEEAENEESNQGNNNFESENEEEKWEQEQIRKGFQISQTITQVGKHHFLFA